MIEIKFPYPDHVLFSRPFFFLLIKAQNGSRDHPVLSQHTFFSGIYPPMDHLSSGFADFDFVCIQSLYYQYMMCQKCVEKASYQVTLAVFSKQTQITECGIGKMS